MAIEYGDPMYMETIRRLERERELVVRLTELLQQEVGYITNQDVEALEDSMPEKQRILRDIADNRQGKEAISRDSRDRTPQMRDLQHDLIRLWKKASGLNDLSKIMVKSRLSEIERELEPFIAREKNGYNREGKKSGAYSRRVNTGV